MSERTLGQGAEFFEVLTWAEPPNDVEYLNRFYPSPPMRLRRDFKHFLKLGVRKSDSGKIIILYPGHNESIDGPSNRYETLARQMHQDGLGTVIRSANKAVEGFLPITALTQIIDYSLVHSMELAGTEKPDLYLFGYSSGGAAAASLSGYYEAIKKLLLIAPSGNMPLSFVSDSLNLYQGETYIVVGEDDEVVTQHAGYIYHRLATASAHKELFIIENCDHYFTGELNDRIFRRAPFYAFGEDESLSLI